MEVSFLSDSWVGSAGVDDDHGEGNDRDEDTLMKAA